MKTINAIQKKIAALQSQADKLTIKEKEGVVARMNEAIAHYGIKPSDLNFRSTNGKRGPKARKVESRVGKSSPIKYRHGDNEWSGRGRPPKWVVDHRAAGNSLEEFAV